MIDAGRGNVAKDIAAPQPIVMIADVLGPTCDDPLPAPRPVAFTHKTRIGVGAS